MPSATTISHENHESMFSRRAAKKRNIPKAKPLCVLGVLAWGKKKFCVFSWAFLEFLKLFISEPYSLKIQYTTSGFKKPYSKYVSMHNGFYSGPARQFVRWGRKEWKKSDHVRLRFLAGLPDVFFGGKQVFTSALALWREVRGKILVANPILMSQVV